RENPAPSRCQGSARLDVAPLSPRTETPQSRRTIASPPKVSPPQVRECRCKALLLSPALPPAPSRCLRATLPMLRIRPAQLHRHLRLATCAHAQLREMLRHWAVAEPYAAAHEHAILRWVGKAVAGEV